MAAKVAPDPQSGPVSGGLDNAVQELIAGLTTASVNGITIRYADTAPGDMDRPVVVLIHGWPESWFAWRHQLVALHAAGYRAIAADQRGFGGTSAPTETAEYSVEKRCGDLIGLLKHLGVQGKAAFIGHDHGGDTGWWLSALHPEVVACYFAISTSYYRRKPKMSFVELLRKLVGDEREPEGSRYGKLHYLGLGCMTKPKPPMFHYMLHHHLPGAAAYYDKDSRGTLLAITYGDRVTGAKPPSYPREGPMYIDGKTPAIWERMAQPTQLVPWVTQAEFDYVVQQFELSGWQGGLHWYKTMHPDWEATPQLSGEAGLIKVPAGFLAGGADNLLKYFKGPSGIRKSLRKTCVGNTPPVTIVDGASHWVMQERPQETNAAVLSFLKEHWPSSENCQK